MLLLEKSVLILLVLAIGYSIAEDNSDQKPTKSDRVDFKKSLSKDCATSFSLTCFKLDIVSWVDKLDGTDDLNVLPGLTVVKEKDSTNSINTGDVVAELAREFPNDPEARLDAYLMKKIQGYLASHSIKLDLWNTANAIEEGRGKGGGGGGGGGKKGGGMEGLLALAAMWKATLAAIALGGLALLAKKALLVASAAFFLASILGLKHLIHHEHHSTTHEVIAKPIYHEEHGGHYGHSSYGRSFDVPLPVGLQPDYKPEP